MSLIRTPLSKREALLAAFLAAFCSAPDSWQPSSIPTLAGLAG